jgi:predicted MFS family arabinose efflux permease
VAGLCTFLAGLFCLVIWIFAKSYGVLIFFAIVVGTVTGTFWATVGPVVSEVVGLQILPSALSIAWIMLVLPCTFAEPIGLELRTRSGDIYGHAQVFTGFMYIAAAICMWFLRAWKITELEKRARTNEQRERGIGNDDAVLEERHNFPGVRASSIKSKANAVEWLRWSWQRV